MLMGFLEYTRLVPGDGAAPRGGDSLPPPPPGRAAIGGIVNAAPLGEWIGAGYKAAPCDGRAAFAPRHCERRSGGPAGGGDPERQRLKPGKRERDRGPPSRVYPTPAHGTPARHELPGGPRPRAAAAADPRHGERATPGSQAPPFPRTTRLRVGGGRGRWARGRGRLTGPTPGPLKRSGDPRGPCAAPRPFGGAREAGRSPRAGDRGGDEGSESKGRRPPLVTDPFLPPFRTKSSGRGAGVREGHGGHGTGVPPHAPRPAPSKSPPFLCQAARRPARLGDAQRHAVARQQRLGGGDRGGNL